MLIYEKKLIPVTTISDTGKTPAELKEEGKIFELISNDEQDNMDEFSAFCEVAAEGDYILFNTRGENYNPSAGHNFPQVVGMGVITSVDADSVTGKVVDMPFNFTCFIDEDAETGDSWVATAIENEDGDPATEEEIMSLTASADLRRLFGVVDGVIPSDEDPELTYVVDGVEMPITPGLAAQGDFLDDTHGGIIIRSKADWSQTATLAVKIGNEQIIPPAPEIVSIEFVGEQFDLEFGTAGQELEVPKLAVEGTTRDGQKIDVSDLCTYSPVNGTPINQIVDVSDPPETIDITITCESVSTVIAVPIHLNFE